MVSDTLISVINLAPWICPELPEHEEVVAEPQKPVQEFEPLEDEPDDEVQRQRVMQRNFSAATRQAPLDRADDLGM